VISYRQNRTGKLELARLTIPRRVYTERRNYGAGIGRTSESQR
jgi:hypothetical protein